MTVDRAEKAAAFLKAAGFGGFARDPLAGDASMRRYERLTSEAGDAGAVLMDAPPGTGEDVRPFVRIARHLSALGLSAPHIIAQDPDQGFLLLEDLGDDLYSRIIDQAPGSEHQLYTAATDVLVTLQRGPGPPSLAHYDADLMSEQSCLVFDTYAHKIIGHANQKQRARFRSLFRELLYQTTNRPPVMILRDYHAENLLWLAARTGVARVGLLDFQDAMLAHPAYDLVSLLQDARRDVPHTIEQRMIGYFVDQSGQDDQKFRTAYSVLGAQRALRILGVFARLAITRGKPHYVSLVPRVWAQLMHNLEHPALAPVAGVLTDALPAPSRENLAKLMPK